LKNAEKKRMADLRRTSAERGIIDPALRGRKGWVGCKTIFEPGRAAYKTLIPEDAVMFDILLAELLSCSAANAHICSGSHRMHHFHEYFHEYCRFVES
jgi:hypothetical protein